MAAVYPLDEKGLHDWAGRLGFPPRWGGNNRSDRALESTGDAPCRKAPTDSEVRVNHSFRCPVLDALPREARDGLLERAVPRRLRRGERLCIAGDRSGRVHVVVSGVLKLAARSGDGKETILLLAVAGEVTGDIAAVDGLGQPFDAIAACRSYTLGLDASRFLEVVTSHPAAVLELAELLARRTRWVADTALERTSSEVPARLAGRLLDLGDLLGRVGSAGIDIELPLAQEELGGLAGMCRESTCKTLRHFKSEGLLDYRGRRLRLLRPDLLERIRCGGTTGKNFR